jgi:lysophospholipase L1-like esterase
MNEQSGRSQVTLRLRWILMRLFQIFIVICLVDGFLDIVFPLARFTKHYLTYKISENRPPGAVEQGSVQDFIWPRSGLPIRQEPGMRGIVAEYHSPSINIAADGLRSNGQSLPEKVRSAGFLLGASTALGYGVADNQTLAANLERVLKNVRIDNYAVPGQTTSESTLRWYDLQKKKGKPNFVIIAGASYQIFNDCEPIPAENATLNIILFLADWATDKYSPKKSTLCASSESIDLAVRNSILAMENAVAFGRKQGIPFHIVYLPTPYDANVNIDNLLKTVNEKASIAVMQRVLSRYHEELAKLNLPEFIDLSHALPSDRMYFLDMGGHLSAEGNRLIAEILSLRIWGKTHSEKARKGQDIPVQ